MQYKIDTPCTPQSSNEIKNWDSDRCQLFSIDQSMIEEINEDQNVDIIPDNENLIGIMQRVEDQQVDIISISEDGKYSYDIADLYDNFNENQEILKDNHKYQTNLELSGECFRQSLHHEILQSNPQKEEQSANSSIFYLTEMQDNSLQQRTSFQKGQEKSQALYLREMRRLQLSQTQNIISKFILLSKERRKKMELIPKRENVNRPKYLKIKWPLIQRGSVQCTTYVNQVLSMDDDYSEEFEQFYENERVKYKCQVGQCQNQVGNSYAL